MKYYVFVKFILKKYKLYYIFYKLYFEIFIVKSNFSILLIIIFIKISHFEMGCVSSKSKEKKDNAATNIDD